MELDKRSCHFIVTVNRYDKPKEEDIPLLNASVVIAKWSSENSSLSVWYSWLNAQRPSSVTNAWGLEHIVVNHAKLDKKPGFMAIKHDWIYTPQIAGPAEQVKEIVATIAADVDSDEETVALMHSKIKRKRQQLEGLQKLQTEYDAIVASIKKFKEG